jgi:peptidoglycan/xylan/chitin deacetylase (PgdA/CDA1 family)
MRSSSFFNLIPRFHKTSELGRGRILLYHRIIDISSDPSLLAVSPRRFCEHLRLLRETCEPLSLSELLSRGGENIPRNAIALTFDDGYQDNFTKAFPLLKRFDIPATIFVTSGYIGKAQEFWWDEVERCILDPALLPDCITLQLGGISLHHTLVEDSTRETYQGTNDPEAGDPSPCTRRQLFDEILQCMMGLDREERDRCLESIRQWVGISPGYRKENRPLSEEELITLADDPLIEIGSHSVNHTVLSLQEPLRQEEELRKSRTDLEALTGRPVRFFAYPYGAPRDFSALTIKKVRQAGYLAACANSPGFVMPDMDRCKLPRFLVRDWDTHVFSRNFQL